MIYFAIICGKHCSGIVPILNPPPVWRAFVIAKSARNRFEFGLVGGIALHIALQSVLHIAVVTGTLPNTGIGLPFISAGGSSIIFILIEAGMVLSVSRTARINSLKREKKANGN